MKLLGVHILSQIKYDALMANNNVAVMQLRNLQERYNRLERDYGELNDDYQKLARKHQVITDRDTSGKFVSKKLTCPICGEKYPDKLDECPKCHASISYTKQ